MCVTEQDCWQRKKCLPLCLIIPCALVFTACDKDDDKKPTFTVGQNVLTLANDIVDDLTLIYNNAPASTTFNLEQLKQNLPSQFSNFKYYVAIGEVDEIDDVNSITLGSKFTKDQTFKLSLGNNAQLEANAFYEEDDVIYVAAPVIVFETVNLGKIKINENEFEFDLEVEATASNFTNIAFRAGASSTVTEISDTEYDLNFKKQNEYITLTYEGATANDVVLTKKVIGNSVSYGLTTVENLEGNPLGLYPIGYSTDPLDQSDFDAFDGKSMDYSAYVLNKGVYNVKLNFNIILPQ